MKSNTMIMMILMYLAVFGIQVKNDPLLGSQVIPMCAKIKTTPVTAPATIPIINENMLANKDYVIRVLIKHIKSQNEHIKTSNDRINNIINAYNKCSGR